MFSSDIGMSGGLSRKIRMALWLGLLCLIIVGLLPACEDSTPATPTVGSTPEPLVTDTPQPTDMVALDPTTTNTPLPTFTPTVESLVTNTSEPTDMATLDPTTTNTPLPTFTSIPEPSPTFTPSPEPTGTPSPEEIAIDNLSHITRWLDNPPDRAHDVVRYALADMWLKDANLAENVARLHWVIDGVTEVEMRFVSVLRELVRIDVELAEQVLDLPMVADVSPDSELAVHSSLEWLAFGLAENSVDVAKVVLGYSWIIDGVTDRELYALDGLSSLLSNDPEFGKVVASFDWISDGLSDRDLSVLDQLIRLVEQDSELPVHSSLEVGLVTESVELAKVASGYSWVIDGVTDRELYALDGLSYLMIREPEFGKVVAGYSWVIDGVTDRELYALDALINWGEQDSKLNDLVASFAWIRDGLSDRELFALDWLSYFASLDSELGDNAVNLRWISDGITEVESEAVGALSSLAQVDVELAHQTLTYKWVVNGITYWEQETLESLDSLAETNRELAEEVIAFEWISESNEITSIAADPINRLALIANRDLALAMQLVEYVSDGLTHLGSNLILNLSFLMQEFPYAFQQLTSQPWYMDGLDDEEAAFIATVGDIVYNSRSDYEEMLQTRFVQSGTVALPLAGDVNIWVIQKAPFPEGENLVSEISEAVKMMEELMSVPFPTTDVVVLVVVASGDSEYEVPYSNIAVPWPGAGHAGSHVRIPRYEEYEPIRYHTLYHELGHYYFKVFPAWILEGWPQFAAAYIRDRKGIESLEEREVIVSGEAEANCISEGIENIHQLGTPGLWYRISPSIFCFYVMGEHFFINMYLALGIDVTSSVLRDLHNPVGNDLLLSGKDVFLSFMANTPANQIEEFTTLFNELHGGPLADFIEQYGNPLAGADLGITDDYGNDSSTALRVSARKVVDGTLEHPFDVDYFVTRVEAGTEYRIMFNHDAGDDFYFTLLPADGGPAEDLSFYDGGDPGLELRWTALNSGDHLLAVESAIGTIGSYSLEIVPPEVVAMVDNHADDADNATVISTGETVSGVIVSDSDLDYFRLHMDSSRGYDLEIVNETLGLVQVSLYGPDGKPDHDLGYSGGWDNFGARLYWNVPKSDDYYLIVEGIDGSTGSYTLTVNAISSGGDDHGDDAASATDIAFGEVVDGVLDHEFDADYFQFYAEYGQSYSIRINYLTTNRQEVVIFAPDGVTPVYDFFAYDEDREDSYIPWVAPDTGEYFVAISSTGASTYDTGDYELNISPAAVVDGDDHSDSASSATEVSVGSMATGELERQGDFDFFRFSAEEGQRYRIEGKFSDMSEPRVTLYTADGSTPVMRYHDLGRTATTKWIEWVPANSGEYYAVVWSADENVGTYELSISGP